MSKGEANQINFQAKERVKRHSNCYIWSCLAHQEQELLEVMYMPYLLLMIFLDIVGHYF